MPDRIEIHYLDAEGKPVPKDKPERVARIVELRLSETGEEIARSSMTVDRASQPAEGITLLEAHEEARPRSRSRSASR